MRRVIQKDVELPDIPSKTIIIVGGVIFLLFIILIGGLLSITIVSPGERGVRITFGQVEPINLGEGLHFKIPFAQDIIKLDVKAQKVEAASSAASKDLQIVTTSVALQYRIQPDQAYKLLQEIGVGFQSKIIDPAIQESVKATTAKFTAEELVTQRPIVKTEIENALRERLAKNYIETQEISITEFTFSDQFDKAIEAKVTAEQDALKAVRELERIKIEAEQRVTQAKAESDSKKLEADAEAYRLTEVATAKAFQIEIEGAATAEAFRVQREQLSPDLVELKAIEKWLGEVPYYNGVGAVPFLDLTGKN